MFGRGFRLGFRAARRRRLRAALRHPPVDAIEMQSVDDLSLGNGILIRERVRHDTPKRLDGAIVLPLFQRGTVVGQNVDGAVYDDAAPIQWTADLVYLESNVRLVRQ